MLEIPESHTIASQLQQTVSGQVIRDVQVAQSPHGFAFYFEDPAKYPLLLVGQSIRTARAVAGFVQIDTEDAQLLFNDGVNIRYYPPGAKLPPKHQLLLELESGGHITCSVQMYGALLAFPSSVFSNPYFEAAQSKPSPLSPDFTQEYFEYLCLQTPGKLSVKALLATEQRIPGLGNGCLQDILFRAGIHPQSKAGSLSSDKRTQLYKSITSTLLAMTQGGGRDTEKDLFGKPGGYKTLLSAATVKSPCPSCFGTLVRKAYMGGNVYFCPNCQPLL